MDVLQTTKLIACLIICVMAMWRVIYLHNVKWLSLGVTLVFFSMIVVDGYMFDGIKIILYKAHIISICFLALVLVFTNIHEFNKRR